MLVLVDMLSYELGAHVAFAFEPDGLRCRVRFPLPPLVGHLAEEHAPGEP